MADLTPVFHEPTPRRRKRKDKHLLAGPVGTVLEHPRPCSRCHTPTIFGTARGRPVHPACEGWLDYMDPLTELETIKAVARQLPVALVAMLGDAKPKGTPPVVFTDAPCSICGAVPTLRCAHIHPQWGAYRDRRCRRHVMGHPDEYGVPWQPTRDLP